jgi:hypothetical protein
MNTTIANIATDGSWIKVYDESSMPGIKIFTVYIQ